MHLASRVATMAIDIFYYSEDLIKKIAVLSIELPTAVFQ